jgi:GNAT superfamily N-acetyltransferase
VNPPAAPQLLLKLRDGTPVLLRMFSPADRAAVQEAFRRLSLDSHYYRFWTQHRELPDSLLNRFLNPEPGLHETWAVLDPAAADEPGHGGGSFWRQEDEPWRAEISFTVADEVQHRGVGTLLLALLWIRAREAGINQFFGVVLPDNYAVLDWFRSLGARVTLHGGQYAFELELDETRLKTTPTAVRFKEKLREVEAGFAEAG